MAPFSPVSEFRRVLSSLNCDGRWGLALALTCLALLAPELAGDAGRAALRYERDALAAGEWWRLVTGHFVHLGVEHALLNAVGLTLLWALFARDYRPFAWLLILAGAIAAIDLGLWTRDSTVRWYVGSSGALHGILAAGTLAHLRRRDFDGWILAVFLIAKLAWEQWSGALPFAGGSIAVVVDAHLYGALGGLAVAATMTPNREPL